MIDNKFTKWCVDDADKTITVQIISDGVIISMNNNYDNTRLYIYSDEQKWKIVGMFYGQYFHL